VKRLLFTISFWLLLSGAAWAHDPGLSGTIGKLAGSQLGLTLSFAIRDAAQIVPLDANNDGVVTPAEFDMGRERLAASIASQCEVKFDGALAKPETIVCQQDDAKNVSVRLTFSVPPAKQLTVDFKIIQAMPLGHRMFFSLSDAAGKTLNEQLLTASCTLVTVPLEDQTAAPEKPAHTFTDFVLMGVEHIGTGYDHLLFLFALLVVTRTFRSAAVVITAFTIAHSITLAIATFNLVKIPPVITESLIAATIAYVGLENLLRRGAPHKRWLLAFCFGLIHGFGFATILHEMGVGQRAGGVVLPLFGFNLGVELAQLGFVIALLPLFVGLAQWPHGAKVQNAASFVIFLLGLGWFSIRAFHLKIPGLA
jgi:hypothetical protein